MPDEQLFINPDDKFAIRQGSDKQTLNRNAASDCNRSEHEPIPHQPCRPTDIANLL